MACTKCNDSGFVPGETKKENVVNGSEFEYPTYRFCECQNKAKEQQLINKICKKTSWVDKYRKKDEDDEG